MLPIWWHNRGFFILGINILGSHSEWVMFHWFIAVLYGNRALLVLENHWEALMPFWLQLFIVHWNWIVYDIKCTKIHLFSPPSKSSLSLVIFGRSVKAVNGKYRVWLKIKRNIKMKENNLVSIMTLCKRRGFFPTHPHQK